MTYSQACIDLVKRFEGCRLTAYADPIGKWTVGYGHTSNVSKGDAISQEQADAYLEMDLTQAAHAVNEGVRVPLTQGQFDALCCFVFNVGAARWLGSTLRRLCDQGDFAAAAGEFPKWVHAGKNVLGGLVDRRAAELALFQSSQEVNA